MQVILLVLRIKKLAVQITKGIVYLLETLEHIIKLKRHSWQIKLYYKSNNKEINELNLTFNRVIRTLQQAMQSFQDQ